ncbi:unnamed protein product, partial [Dicrocoelium dendriticum]
MLLTLIDAISYFCIISDLNSTDPIVVFNSGEHATAFINRRLERVHHDNRTCICKNNIGFGLPQRHLLQFVLLNSLDVSHLPVSLRWTRENKGTVAVAIAPLYAPTIGRQEPSAMWNIELNNLRALYQQLQPAHIAPYT